jgi:two-component system sensor histidine kinase CpxA
VLLRIPFLRDGSAPFPGTVVARVPGLFALLRMLDLLPWLGVAAGGFALSVVFWLPLVGGITAALRRLTAATEAISEGRFDTRVPEARRDELGHLGRSVNRMAARLDTLVNGQRRFLGDVAHELGSPLGRLQVATEILEQRAGADLRPAVGDVREEVQQMALLVNELLAFTRAGLRPRETELVAVELAPLAAEVLAREDPEGRVRPAVPAGLAALADRELLARALANLVRNALRYAGPGAAISLDATRVEERIHLGVADTGPGVPPEALERLGEPFYRPESARTRETGGVGLGLAIVRSAAAACGGDVRFSTLQPTGFRAELLLRPA